MKKKAIILDRDGTLIVDKVYLNDPNAIEYLPGVFEALRIFRDLGYLFAVATNQSGVARGIVSLENLAEIHRRMKNEFAKHQIDLASFHYAPYMTDSNHHMRKPNSGMLEEAAQTLGLDLRLCWMAGDRMTDVEAGHRAGCRSILLGQTEDPKNSEFAPPEVWTDTLLEAARQIQKMEG